MTPRNLYRCLLLQPNLQPLLCDRYTWNVYKKVLSNAQEAKARDARLIGVTPMNDSEASDTFNDLLPIPAVEDLLSPILTVIPLQLWLTAQAEYLGIYCQ